MRAFIAIPLPLYVKKEIWTKTAPIRKYNEVKCVKMENLHITLKFLGEITEEQKGVIDRILIRSNFSSFSLKLIEIGGFPNLKSPRVLWVKVSPEEQVKEIFKTIENNLIKEGFNAEKRKYHPHITIARIRKKTQIPTISGFKETFKVNELVFMKSTLTREGPIYSPLGRYKLQNESRKNLQTR